MDDHINHPDSHTWPFRFGAASDIGRERAENEDAFYINPEIGLFLVADGMGGHQGGQLASRIVKEDLPVLIENRLHRLKKKAPNSLGRLLRQTIPHLNRQLRLEGHSESGYKDMGSTLALVLLQNNRAYIANVGDSRVYRFRRGKLKQLSKDHSVISHLLENGDIQPHEADDHPAGGQITRYVGMEEDAVPHVTSFTLATADRLLLCSDGLTDMIADPQITAILTQNHDPQTCCDKLIAAANQASSHDNITVITLDWQKQS